MSGLQSRFRINFFFPLKRFGIDGTLTMLEIWRSNDAFLIATGDPGGLCMVYTSSQKSEAGAAKYIQLMPKEIFVSKAAKLRPSMDGIVELGRVFGTSLDATARRIISLGAWNAVIIWCVPARMAFDRWAAKIEEFRYCDIPKPPPSGHGDDGYVWWAGDVVKRTFDSNLVVKDRLSIDGNKWRFEGISHVRRVPKCESQRSVIALLVPE